MAQDLDRLKRRFNDMFRLGLNGNWPQVQETIKELYQHFQELAQKGEFRPTFHEVICLAAIDRSSFDAEGVDHLPAQDILDLVSEFDGVEALVDGAGRSKVALYHDPKESYSLGDPTGRRKRYVVAARERAFIYARPETDVYHDLGVASSDAVGRLLEKITVSAPGRAY